MRFYPIINRHAAWLVANPVQGCPNNCKYCFLQSVDGTKTKPQVLLPVEEIIEKVKSSTYYVEDVPICFFSQTDIFATKENINYISSLLDILATTSLPNPLVFITKCNIPDFIIDKIYKLTQREQQVIVYLSYSGLDKSIEGGIDVDIIKENFKKLKSAGIKVIHYFRPIVPQNSSVSSIENIISYVSKYAMCSVVAGLKVEEAFQKKLSFWPEIMNDSESINSECVWPKESRQTLRKIAQKYKYPLFEVNSCALAYVLNQTERYGFFGTKSCINFNCCPTELRSRCSEQKLNEELSLSTIEAKLPVLLSKLGKKCTSIAFDYGKDSIVINNIKLTTEETCYLSGELHVRVDCKHKSDGFYWNTSINQKGGLEK